VVIASRKMAESQTVRFTPLLAMALLAAAGAWLAPPKMSAFAAPRARDTKVSQLAASLQRPDADADAVGRAVDALIALGGTSAADAIARFIRAGQPDALTDRALERMIETPFPAALALLGDLTRHRRAHVRQLAYGALAQLEPSRRPPVVDAASVDAMLAQGLRDSDAGVRGRCARALGERGAAAQLPVLFVALERGVPEAGAAIGRLGDAAAVARFHEHLGKRPIGVMLAGYEQFLARDELSEKTKLDIVAQLGEVASPSVKLFLERVLATGDFPPRGRLVHALRETAKRIEGVKQDVKQDVNKSGKQDAKKGARRDGR
jgi:hypothetical protein